MSDVRHSLIKSLGWTCAVALVAGLAPVSAAYAQSNPRVRIASEEADVKVSRRANSELLTTVSEGATFEVLHMAGDPYAYRETNWYLVVLPADAFGRAHMGWIDGRHVQELPPLPPTPRPEPARTMSSSMNRNTPAQTVQPMPAAGFTSGAAAAAVAAEPEPVEIAPVVVHFAFDKSDLSPEARSTLDCAMEMMVDGQAMAFAVEGHTDATGPDAYNQKLGMARADAVKSYLIEAHQIPMDKITVSSHGESMPDASNDTSEGRAMNRRVVVRVGG